MASAKADDRGSFGSKRSRNDVPRNEGDWTCPQCGNMNFSFRTVCNRSKCGAARPSPSPRVGSVPLPGRFDPPPYYLGGVAAQPLMPLGMPSGYRVPLPYSGMRYDYGPPASAPGPYGLLPGYGPPGPMGGSLSPHQHPLGFSYGPASGMEGYGYGFRGSPMPVPNSWQGGDSSDNIASRKRRGGPDGLSEGDWVCPKCGNVNFAFRTSCNMKKCGTPRPTPAPNRDTSGNKDSAGTPEGSWTCSKCGNLNYPFRTVCNRKGCGNERPSGVTSQ